MFEKLMELLERFISAYEKDVHIRNNCVGLSPGESCECKNEQAVIAAVNEKYPPEPMESVGEPEVLTGDGITDDTTAVQKVSNGESVKVIEPTEFQRLKDVAIKYGIKFRSNVTEKTLAKKIYAYEAENINVDIPPEGLPVKAASEEEEEPADNTNIFGEPLTTKSPEVKGEVTEEKVREAIQRLIHDLGGPKKAMKKVVEICQKASGYSKMSAIKEGLKDDSVKLQDTYVKLMDAVNKEREALKK